MRKVYLIRHGKTAANEKSLYYGVTDVSISQKGISELQKLKAAGVYPEPSQCTVFISGMKRTKETLDIIFPGEKYQIEPDFREMNFGKFEMHSYEELKNDPEYQTWITGDFMANVCPGGESGNIQCERAVNAFWRVLENTEGDIIIISHSGTVIGIMQALFPNEGENRWYWSCSGGCGYTVVMDGEKPISYNRIPNI